MRWSLIDLIIAALLAVTLARSNLLCMRLGGGQGGISPVSAAAVMISLGLVGNLATNTVRVGRWWWSPLLWTMTGLLATIALVNERIRHRSNEGSSEQAECLEQAVFEVGDQVRRQWDLEAVSQRLHQPVPVHVRWSSTERPVAASRDVVLDESGTEWHEMPLEGHAEQLVDAFRTLPHQQLVVLGEPGAGKTVMVMLLTLALLKHPTPGEPIPVLLPISSWNPEAEDIEAFGARRLCEEYGFLRRSVGTSRQGRNLAETLLVQRRLLLVLDGLDELPAERRGQALRLLDKFAARGQSLIITCRGSEYEQAVNVSGALLSRAAVVEIAPVDVEQAITFLSHPAPFRQRWEKVFSYLRSYPDSSLAVVLRTPLMVSLARSAYMAPDADPSSLLIIPNQNTITEGLIDQFISNVYVDAPRPGFKTDRTVRSYQPTHVNRWLGYLAYELYRSGRCDLWWWQLSLHIISRLRHAVEESEILSRIVVIAPVALLSIDAFLLGFTPITRIVALIDVGVILFGAAAAGVLRPLWSNTVPPYSPKAVHATHTITRRRWYYVTIHVGFGVTCGLMTGLLLGDPLYGITSGLLYGLIMLVMPTWIMSNTLHCITPSATFRASHLNTVTIAAQSGLIAGLLFSALARVIPGRVDVLTAGCTAALVYAVAAALGSGFFSWIYFRISHLWLATRGRLPWRLYAFLDDAHRRGVLRQAGTSWRFRHAIVQDHLAREERVGRLRSLAAGGHAEASARLANLLSEMGHGDEAIAIMKTVADDVFMGREKLAGLLGIHGRMDDLAALADDGDTDAAWVLADQLLAQGKREEAIAVLWTCATRADTTNIGTRVSAASRLTELLAEEGRIDELRTLADNGDLGGAAWQLADLLAERGQIDEAVAILRFHESNGNQFAGWKLSNLLAKHGRIADLQDLADSGNATAFARYVEVLDEEGKTDEAIAALRAHARELFIDRKLASLLAKQGRDDEAVAVLRTYPEDPFAAIDLAKLLAGQNQVDDAVAALSPHVSREIYAVRALAELLTDHGRADEAVVLLNSIISKRPVYRRKQSTRYLDYLMKMEQDRRDAASYLAGLLAQLGRIDDLQARASKGDEPAGIQLANLLATEGRFDEAIALVRARADNGEMQAKEKLAELLAQSGRDDEAIAILQAIADTGNRYARKLLTNLRSKLESGAADQ